MATDDDVDDDDEGDYSDGQTPTHPKKKSKTDEPVYDAVSVSQASQTNNKIKFKPKAIQLPADVVADLIEWYKHHGGLYPK